MEDRPTKKGQEVDIQSFIGKRVLFALKRDTIENSIPENAYEGDVLSVEGGYVNMNCRLNDGKIVNEWKWTGFLRIIRILGPAVNPEPYTYEPPKGRIKVESESRPIDSMGAVAIAAVGEIREQLDGMRHELTATRHMVGTWCEDPSTGDVDTDEGEKELYFESHDYLMRKAAEENVRLKGLLDEQAKDIAMIKKVLTVKGMIA
jgi:hypothetical protein